VIKIIASPRAAHQRTHAAAMAAGLVRHGLTAEVTHRALESGPDDTVICWGWREGQQHRARGSQVLVMERGYIGDRFVWTSLAWNGLNNLGDFPSINDSGARFLKHFPGALQPWQPEGAYVLIAGQVPGDMSLRGTCLADWYAAKAAEYAAQGDPVRFRPHPLAHRREPVRLVPGAPILSGDLAVALAGAKLVVTFNSNLGVDALLAGKPTSVADSGGMAYGITEATREDWAHRLAWRQFTIDEIESGFAWEVANG
jgi:hypothetical protein